MSKLVNIIILIIINLILYNNFINNISLKKDFSVEVKYNSYYKDKYLGYIEIPGVFREGFLQYNDNSYYLNHDSNGNFNRNGSLFLDYRNKLDDNKLIIYGHSGNDNRLVFNNLNNYNDDEFFNNNKYIYLDINNNRYIYKIFSVYIESNDFDYLNLNYNYDHLLKLKNKSLYNTYVNLNLNKILLLQTCSSNVSNKNAYQIVIGILQ